MCNDYAREIEISRVISMVKEMQQLPPLSWVGGRTPNDIAPQPHIKISESGFVVGWEGGDLLGELMTWSWKTAQGKPVFNYISEGRDFSNSERVLILATGFYENTQPKNPKVKLRDQHFFTMKEQEWFWIAGVVQQECFTMLTTEPGPDVKHYHDRQICVIAPQDGMRWMEKADGDILRPLPKDTLKVRTTRKNGEVLADARK